MRLFAVLVLLPLAPAAPFHYIHSRVSRPLQHRASAGGSQSSLTLDKSQVQSGLKRDGQQDAAVGQVASLTSPNNFINFCSTQKGVPLTNGTQVKAGSCNPTVMGRIIAEDVMPSSKFIFPPNLDSSLKENETFTIKMAVKNLHTGHFVNPLSNYFAAPSQVNDQGQLIGHSHVVIQAIPAMDSTAVLDPIKFAFFQGLNAEAVDGVLCAKVTKGLPAGTYRMGSINTAANHQPALVSVAQHGMLDDIVYFTVKSGGPKKGNCGSSSTKIANSSGASDSISSMAPKTTSAANVCHFSKVHNGARPCMNNAMHSSVRLVGRSARTP